jgi:hypothetical protein
VTMGRANAVVRIEGDPDTVDIGHVGWPDGRPPILAFCKCGHEMRFIGLNGLPISTALPLGGERARYRCPHCSRVGWHDLPFVAQTEAAPEQGSFD